MTTCTTRPVTDLPDVMTVQEVATLLRVGMPTAYQMIRRGDVPSAKLGRKIFVSKAALLSKIEGNA